MSLLAWFDNRTLLACQFILAVVFAAVFLGMQRAFPTMRGLRSASIAFLLGIPGSFAVVLRGLIPLLASVILGNLLVLAAIIFVYDAIVRFTRGPRLTNYLWPILIPALVVLWYYTSIRPDIVPRIIVTALASVFPLAFTAWELLARSSASSSRLIMRILGVFFLSQAVIEIGRAVMTILYGAPQNYMFSDPVQTLTLAFNIFYLCAATLCFLFMVIHELITHAREESFQDPLSGALNRRGIEDKLAIELKRINRSPQKLSIALIDVDHFKSINDSQGHAAGDAALRGVVEAISERLRAYDYIGRFGGDEFLLLLPQTPWQDSLTVTNRIDHAVRGLTILPNGQSLTISIGITEAIPTDDATTILAVPIRLYQAKTAGRSCSRVQLADTSIEVIGDLLVSTSQPNLVQS